jgi:hypothetical protein
MNEILWRGLREPGGTVACPWEEGNPCRHEPGKVKEDSWRRPATSPPYPIFLPGHTLAMKITGHETESV